MFTSALSLMLLMMFTLIAVACLHGAGECAHILQIQGVFLGRGRKGRGVDFSPSGLRAAEVGQAAHTDLGSVSGRPGPVTWKGFQ